MRGDEYVNQLDCGVHFVVYMYFTISSCMP